MPGCLRCEAARASCWKRRRYWGFGESDSFSTLRATTAPVLLLRAL